jgi:Thioredoxin-like
MVGHVASTEGSVAGFFVEMWSFQGEEEGRSDVRHAFTDEKGAFAADYLPGSSYCVFVNDARSVSNILDLMPYDPVTGKTNAPSLTISQGKPVEVTVTSGPGKVPVAHQFVHLDTPHEYSWRENGRTQSGGGSRRWWVITDEHGKARTFALPGAKIEGSINESEWRSKVSADVKTDGVTRLEFHREFADARRIAGRLLLTGVAADLNAAIVEIGSVDGETHERLTVAANAKGEFSFESKSSRIGIYARTKDAKAAATAVVDRLDRPIELSLKPTGEFRGQLLGKEDRPLQGRAVQAEIRVGKPDYSAPEPTTFLAATFDTRTDGDGNYSFSGLPCEVRISISTKALNGRGDESDDIYLVPHEVRPRVVNKLWTRQSKTSVAERYAATLRDCRLSHFGAMVILFRAGGDTKRFVDANFLDYETNNDVGAFMQIQGVLGGKSGQEIESFARSQHWPLPENGKVFALAMDPAGRELGRIEVDAKDPAGPKRAADFIRQYAPAPVDAVKTWDEAFAAARQSDRKVWVRISQRYCGPCFSLTRWLDDQQRLLSRDYVFLKIDDVRDLHGAEVAERLTGSEGQGIPFCGIFDAAGKPLITSESPLGNIGCPSGFEGKRHLRRMLEKTRKKLTDREIDQIVDSLSD